MSLVIHNRPIKCPKAMLEVTPACSDTYFVTPLKPGKNIGIWLLHHPEDEPIVLMGHHQNVTALSLSHHEHGRLLCSCSADNIILWDLLQNDGKPDRGRVLLSNTSGPSYCCFSHDDLKIGFCCNRDIILFDLRSMHFTTLEGHIDNICFCVFGWDNIFFTISEGSWCKMWNIQTKGAINQKYITPCRIFVALWLRITGLKLRSAPSTIAIHCESHHVVVGTVSGSLLVYVSEFHLIRSFQVWRIVKYMKNHNEKIPYPCKPETENNEEGYFESDSSFPVLALYLYCHHESSSSSDRMFPETLYLLVITSTCLFVININSEEITSFLSFKEVNTPEHDICKEIGLIRSAAISSSTENEDEIIVILVPVMNQFVVLIKLRKHNLPEDKLCDSMAAMCMKEAEVKNVVSSDNSQVLSFLSREPVNGSSFLMYKADVEEKTQESRFKKSSPKSNSLCQPVTFHTKIKSSGYGISQSSQMFQPQINKKKSPVAKSPKSADYWLRNITTDYQNIWSSEKPALLSTLSLSNSPIIISTSIAGDGENAVCALNDGSVEIIEVGKDSLKNMHTLNCHNGTVTTANWSHSRHLVVTGSTDRTVKLWRWMKQKQEPALILGLTEQATAAVVPRKFLKSSVNFNHDVTHAQFYYIDQFLLLSCKNSLFLLTYHLDTKKSDVKRYENQSFSKLVTTVQLDSQRITAVAAVNQFFSNLVVCAGSSKCLDVLDMNTGKVTWHVDDVSSKPPYFIAINKGSVNACQPSSMYDIFMTVALCDGIKLWDLRSKRSILCYKEHQCRSVPCGVSFSACGRYIAAGSEDKAVYLYDLRSTSCLHKLANHLDAVPSLSFSPINRQLLVASLNGTLHLYGQEQQL